MSETPVVTMHDGIKTYHCGNLTYTKAGLFVLVAWMLWGDICYTLMEKVVPSILPLKLKDLGCSNWMMGLIMSTIPSIFGMTVCPYISFKSDRFRSRWGRRIPFILVSMPFLCMSLIFLGCSDDISVFCRTHFSFLQQFTPATITITMIAVFMIMFQFFNDFVASVFNYLFNDVVPAQFLSRFMGLFRMAGTIAGAAYNYFVFQYAGSHMREIFIGAAVLYFVGFGLMCLKIKEREYPPFKEESNQKHKRTAELKTFFRESFTHKFYWLIFLGNAAGSISGAIAGFEIFFQMEMGLNLEHIGKLAAIGGIAAFCAMYFAAIFIDRWHPVRITVYVALFNMIALSMNWIWIFVTLPTDFYFWLCLGTNMTATFFSALAVVASTPRQMRLFPQSRYGQFCSAQAMLKWFCIIGAGVIAGLFIDIIKRFYGGSDFAYRFIFLWSLFFSAISTIIGIYVYIEWLRMGGDKHYHPPAPWSPDNVEEIPIVPTRGPASRCLNIAFRLFDAIMVLSVSVIPFMMWWMYCQQTMIAFKWFGFLILPLSLFAWFYWKYVKTAILKVMQRARYNEPLRNGIPHHGMLIVVSIQFLLALALWLIQTIVTVNLKMETSTILFAIANVLTNFMLSGTVHFMARLERGFSTTIDVPCDAENFRQ
jgi:MFS family permease